jgi:uncharacterized membrane protein (DUF2068 family)
MISKAAIYKPFEVFNLLKPNGSYMYQPLLN